MTQRDLSNAIQVPYQRVNGVVRGKPRCHTQHRLRLSRFFGTSPDFWLSLQLRWDLYHARSIETEQIKSIRPHDPVNTLRGHADPVMTMPADTG